MPTVPTSASGTNGQTAYTIPAGFELPAWAGGDLQTFLNSANHSGYPQIFGGANATASPQDLRELPNSNQDPLSWMNQYQDTRRPGWDQLSSANPQWGGASWFNPKKGITNNQAQFMQDIFTGYDFPRIQGAADRQFNRVNDAIGRISSENTENSALIRQAGRGGADTLRALSGTVGDEANRYGAAAVSDAQEGVRRADELAGTGTQSGVAGYEQNICSQMALMRSGTNPDGSPMTAEQYAATQKQMMYDSGAAAGQIRSGYEQQALNMRSQLSQVQLGAGGIAGNMAQLSSSLAMQAEQLNTSTQIAAAQLEAQGPQQEASLMLANPESIVSLSNGLLNMWGVFMSGAAAPQQSNFAQFASVAAPIAGALIGSVVAPGVGTAIGAGVGNAAAGAAAH